MYNEVDRLILNSFVRCFFCDSKDIKYGSFTTTIMGTSAFDDEAGHHHEHDTNYISSRYECNTCFKTFDIAPLNSCWCGWQQQYQSGLTKLLW